MINILVTITVDVDDNENEIAVHKRIDSRTKIDEVCVKSEAVKNCKKSYSVPYSVLMGTEEYSSENSALLEEYRETDSENDDFILDSKLTNLLS